MGDVAARFAEIVGDTNLLSGEAIPEDYAHDEALTVGPQQPAYLAKPGSAEEVAELLKAASEHGVPVTARGSGTGLSGGAQPREDGLVISFERMNAVLEVDTENHVAVVQPGVTLSELDEKTTAAGLGYTVHPGELSASVGGNVGTNAGGMRAVKYGVTRHNVVGLQAVLPTGEIIRTGGKTSKVSTGYDLTQLIIGSEGTLAIATEVIVKLYPRLPHGATVFAPFETFDEVMTVVPKIISSGLSPHILEYIDNLTLAAISYNEKLSLGVPDAIRDTAQAYLVVALENRDNDRLHADIEELGGMLGDLGAMDVYVLEGGSARKLIEAREKAFWTAKAAGADDVIDVVVPRSAMPEFLRRSREMALSREAGALGCGHAGDGNVHLAIFCKDPEKRKQLLTDVFALGMELGGAISGEHGLGKAKSGYFLDLEDPAKIALMRRIKETFDPAGILNPGVLFAERA
ncbi:FAD-binding oxidoreductase [Amycolatopsis thailandensis]|uniref:FAD-binding oxidoreductase n=1 Tax=Amycolatopsis thailandensis TaxID=589330 RepID=A0A229SG26_9PSEU|nr:FAD-binding oxidoreductase [Amycolatopsis thailandensis]OXM57863.1 FAD-binding oxidoreductase [Amycolatopsis thailandensis]